MTDLEALAERAVFANSIVKFSDLSDNRVIQLTLNIRRIIAKTVLIGVACHAKRKKLTRKTKKTLLNTTFKSVFYYL